MSEGRSVAAPELDCNKPAIARAYGALLGGKDNFAADRALADYAC